MAMRSMYTESDTDHADTVIDEVLASVPFRKKAVKVDLHALKHGHGIVTDGLPSVGIGSLGTHAIDVLALIPNGIDHVHGIDLNSTRLFLSDLSV